MLDVCFPQIYGATTYGYKSSRPYLLKFGAVGEGEPNPAPHVRMLSEASRQELGDEVQSTKLPKQQGFLVVVTGIKSLQEMADAGIWRGMSKGVKYEEDWEERTRIKRSVKDLGFRNLGGFNR